MAFELVETVELASGTTSISFSNIPQDAKDLMLWISSHSDGTTNAAVDSLSVSIQGSASSGKVAYYYGNGVGSYSSTSNFLVVANDNVDANAFGCISIYIPNYTNSGGQQVRFEMTTSQDANSNAAVRFANAEFNNGAITTITFTGQTGSGGNVAAHTLASLYKIY